MNDLIRHCYSFCFYEFIDAKEDSNYILSKFRINERCESIGRESNFIFWP